MCVNISEPSESPPIRPAVHSSRRRDRTMFTPDHLDLLEQIFSEDRYPDINLRERLAHKLNVTEGRIQV